MNPSGLPRTSAEPTLLDVPVNVVTVVASPTGLAPVATAENQSPTALDVVPQINTPEEGENVANATLATFGRLEIDTYKFIVPVLDQLIAKLPGTSDMEKFASIKFKAEGFDQEYDRLYEDPDMLIDYGGVLSQVTHLYKYFPVRAALMKIVLSKSPVARRLLAHKDVQVTSFGGGRATDVVGLLGLRVDAGLPSNLHVTIYDREGGWKNCWRTMQRVCPGLEGCQVEYRHLDLTNDATWVEWKSTNMAGIYTISHCLTEIRYHSDVASAFFSRVLTEISVGSILVVIDNGNSSRYSTSRYLWFEELLHEHMFECLEGEDCFESKLTRAYSLTDNRWYGQRVVAHDPQRFFRTYFGIYLKK